jgi:predicted nucleotidyltransferase
LTRDFIHSHPKFNINQSFGYNHNMKTLSEIQQTLQEQQPYLAEKYGVRIVGVFGSYVRKEQRVDSDLDILIELERPPRISLIGLVELEAYLSQLLGVKVDLAIKKNLKKRIGNRILQEVVPI